MDSSPPSRARFKVVAFAVAIAAITYIDRACIGTLAPDIMRDLGLDKPQMSWAYSAFALAYALFEIPTAWWADRRGARRVLTRIVLWWSGFTMLTAATFNFVSLVVVRFLFGAGEAGAWPSVARAFSRWVPRSERGTAQGIFFVGAHLGAGVTPLLVIWLTQSLHLDWRAVFLSFGVLGLVWAVAWFRWFRDDPGEHGQVNSAELQRITAERETVNGHHEGWPYWRKLLMHPNTLPLCVMYLPNHLASYFCITWLPTYLKEKHGFDAMQLGLFAGLPLILSVAGDLFGGLSTDALAKRFGLRIGRCGLGAFAYTMAGGAMILAGVVHQPVVAATLIAMALAATMFTLGAAWGTCLDIGGRHVGVVSAAMNTSGAVGAIISPLMVTALLGAYHNWNIPLYVMGGSLLVGAVCWTFINPHRRIFD